MSRRFVEQLELRRSRFILVPMSLELNKVQLSGSKGEGTGDSLGFVDEMTCTPSK
jgi:hypothetical protein